MFLAWLVLLGEICLSYAITSDKFAFVCFIIVLDVVVNVFIAVAVVDGGDTCVFCVYISNVCSYIFSIS